MYMCQPVVEFLYSQNFTVGGVAAICLYYLELSGFESLTLFFFFGDVVK